jgi:uncharacterized surface protein with fasciclin (FAS1) repeats
MHHTIINNRIFLSCLLFLLLMAGQGCIKKSDSAIGHSEPLKFEGGDLKKALASIDSLSLFRQALDRIGFSANLESNNAYTIFAPGNEAMKAAGLDAAGMQSISTDSLRKIIMYHILPGSIDNMALDNLPVSRFLQTLRLDTIQVPFQGSSVRESYMNVQKGDRLYLNGYAFNNQPPVTASNGYVYPILKFLHNDFIDESRTLWDIVQSEPDLSMFRDAIQLLDSIKESESYLEQEVFWFILSPPSDIPLMSNRKWDPIRNRFNTQGMPLILAPVNQAFYDAGFHSIDDLRTFAFRYPFGVKAYVSPDWSELELKFKFSSLDTLLAMNVMAHGGMTDGTLRYPSRITYADLVKGRLNNGSFNKLVRSIADGFGAYTVSSHNLHFSETNGVAQVQLYPGSQPVSIPKDSDPKQPVNNFNVENGVLYKVNKLFYPFN